MNKIHSIFFLLPVVIGSYSYQYSFSSSRGVIKPTIKKSNDPNNNTNTEKENSESNDSSSGKEDDLLLNIGTSLPFAVDYTYSDLLEYLKPGDIMYDEVGANILGYNTHHVAIIEGIFWDNTFNQYYVRTIEANPNTGVARGLLTPERFNDQKSIFRVLGASSSIINSAIQFCIDQLGEPYDLDIYRQHSESSSYGWYCSELVWAAYYNNTIDLDGNSLYGNGVLPEHIIQSSFTKTIMHYSYNTSFIINEYYHTFCCNGDQFVEPHNHDGDYFSIEQCTVCKHIFWPSC